MWVFNRTVGKVVLCVAVTLVASSQSKAQTKTSSTTQPNSQVATRSLTNDDVVGMLKAGLGADVVIAKIKSSPCKFDTSPRTLENLKTDGVPEPVILAMVDATGAQPKKTPSPPPLCISKETANVAPVVITFAVADNSGIHPGVMGWTRSWVRKNAKKFRDVSFRDCPAAGAKNYLIVFSNSTTALSGFDPVVRTTTSTSTSSVSGNGTAMDSNGSSWDYTFEGDVDTTTTTTRHENIPYTIRSNTLYATAYNQQGEMVSRRWHVFSSKQGGDAANSAGYNLASALFAIDARGRLLHAVVKDIVKKNK